MVETRRERSLSVRVGRGAQIIETVVVLEKEKFVKKATLNERFSSHLLLLLWRTLMCRRMMERRWEVRRLKVSRLMHARPMTCINKKLTNQIKISSIAATNRVDSMTIHWTARHCRLSARCTLDFHSTARCRRRDSSDAPLEKKAF